MTVLLVLYLGVAVVGSAVLDGSDLVPEPCLQGPEVWCKDLVTAAECKKEEYCLAHQSASLWEENSGEEDHALALPKKCLMCIKIMQKLKDLVGDDLDDDTINAAMKSSCKAFGRVLSKLCRSVMKKFKDQIVTALQNNEDAQGACVDVGMCKGPPPGIPAAP
ncbi:antimicrobial peptide NK-lysin-like [Tiliqua scincoides]|uniref:antimicrobial peptide NK-lysin-like n=1 Tax=Tiliqua scincoides TaxID=71010 RepID=UPI0034636BB0